MIFCSSPLLGVPLSPLWLLFLIRAIDTAHNEMTPDGQISIVGADGGVHGFILYTSFNVCVCQCQCQWVYSTVGCDRSEPEDHAGLIHSTHSSCQLPQRLSRTGEFYSLSRNNGKHLVFFSLSLLFFFFFFERSLH